MQHNNPEPHEVTEQRYPVDEATVRAAVLPGAPEQHHRQSQRPRLDQSSHSYFP